MSDELKKFIKEEKRKDQEIRLFIEESQKFLEESQKFLNTSKRKPIRKKTDIFSYLISLQNLPS